MKKLLFYAVLVLIIIFSIELISFGALECLGGLGFVYFPPKIKKIDFVKYQRIRDDYLGWIKPAPCFAPANLSFTQGGPCVSIYGDSFVRGDQVCDAETSENFLSELIHCRILNYGMSGYGTDQSYLLFHNNLGDNSKVVILGHLTEDILRNVNQYRYNIYCRDKHKFGLKPRFVIDAQGNLKLIPALKISHEGFLNAVYFPNEYFKYDYFLPGNKEGFVRADFPYTFTLLKVVLNNVRIKNGILGIPRHYSFYQQDHDSGALNLTYRIMGEFCLEAQKRGKIPVILIIPMGTDLIYYNKYKKWIYENLINKLKENKLSFIDAGPKMIEYLKGADPAELYVRNDLSAHFNAKGNKMLADIIYKYLISNNIISNN